MLYGKTIVLGVSGGIAAYKAVELLRLLTKARAEVHVVMTKNAREFVTPLTFQTLSHHPVHTEMFDLNQEQEIGHISLADRADLFLVAPATANLIGKLANGLADDLLSTSLMATKAPVLLCPAMNTNMYENVHYQRNHRLLVADGYHLLEPISGDLACGWQGAGKLPDPQQIFAEACRLLAPADLTGVRLLITAGPTREELDPVRYLSNYSSGKMGYAIARVAAARGAAVTLISGPVALSAPAGVKTLQVTSALEMQSVLNENYAEVDVVIMAAAVADYRPAHKAEQKIKKNTSEFSLSLERNPDLLAELGQRKTGQILVGFAAETENLVANATTKLKNKNLDLIVANDITAEGAGFGSETNLVKLLFADGRQEELPLLSKDEVAAQLLNRIVLLLKK
ncbi:bifunctional phosphopantothenoylcysteine decarboxylase/phosphopantothenate--cysteine ligase CoaBC [Geopsychrobacter electrodiphilus]|uniref:bifunctional phosphopantothenoylcysteine decarboxylase/phosphopantothenate--cysteine ligase CoaBC n=1 Tax=Geopsychrobacter electrodiphilus TaxID=225196 RepID=UPI00036D6722|nr:bifunctional phosphopantothenoylcysteine decarboxylase/phosphopantothenate--cysteine ligase CoaBC [Geopsychrobacter electrodiphilus]